MFKKPLAALVFMILTSLLTGCDALIFQELKPGVSTSFEVRDRMGSPTMEWKEPDGSVVWEYPRTPNGVVNYMVTIGPDNVLREIRQVLTEENLAKVTPGMSKTEIRRLLGKAAEEMFLPLKKEWVWSWKTQEENNTQTFFDVYFDEDGQVLRTSSQNRPLPG